MMTMEPRPPRLARWLLRLRPLGARRAEIEADLHEVFLARRGREGALRAALRYYADVLSVFAWNPSGLRLFQGARQDLSHGLRVFSRNPVTVSVTILGLSLAIGVSTAVFSLLNAAVLRPVGVSDPATAFRVMRAHSGGTSTAWSYAEYLALRDQPGRTVVEAAFRDGAAFSPVAGGDAPKTVPIAFVSGGYLGTFGARPLLGRMLTHSDDAAGAPPAVVVSYGFWARTLGEDPSIVGRFVWFNGVPVTVAGVTARGFSGVADNPPPFWAPLSVYHLIFGGAPLDRRSPIMVDVVARAAGGATPAQAASELSRLAAAIADRSAANAITGVRLDPAGQFGPGDGGLVAAVVTIVLLVISLVLLLACVNVANLQLASALARQREIAVRLAIGASRGRIVRQLLTESLALGFAGGAIGLLLTVWMLPALAAAVRVPVTMDVAPDYRVYGFVVLVSIAAGVGAGLASARSGTRGDLASPLKGEGAPAASPRTGRLRGVMIGVQAAASILLLVIAGLLTRAVLRATHVDVGFDANRLVTIAPEFGRGQYNVARTRAYWDLALQRIRALEDVAGASLANYLPYSGATEVVMVNRDGRRYWTFANQTESDYFSTLGLRVIRGRTYTTGEVAAKADVAVISETLARDFWAGEDPVGNTLARFDRNSRTVVIGVVSDAITARIRELGAAAIYRPMGKTETARILVRTNRPPETAVPALRAVLEPIDPRMRLNIGLVATALDDELDEPRILAAVAAGLAALALALAVVGIYGVSAFVAGQRTREIGVRMALGARRQDVMALLLRESLRPISIGLGTGMLVALLATRLLAGMLYGVEPHDPVSYAVAASVLFIAAAASVYIPTRRAALADPALVLRRS